MDAMEPAKSEKTLRRGQISIIHVAKDRLRLTDAAYRDLLREAAGVRSATDLTQEGFHAVMRRFEALGFVSGGPRYGHRLGMASPAQLRAIRALWRQWCDKTVTDTEKALRHWMERCYRVSDLRFCDEAIASKAIEGLKAMVWRKRRPTNTQGERHV